MESLELHLRINYKSTIQFGITPFIQKELLKLKKRELYKKGFMQTLDYKRKTGYGSYYWGGKWNETHEFDTMKLPF